MIRQKPKVEALTGVFHHSGSQNPIYEAQQLEKKPPTRIFPFRQCVLGNSRLVQVRVC